MTALEALVGNKTAERVLLFIQSKGQAHAAVVATSFQMPRSQVLKQLVRLEQGGILKGEYVGRSRVFSISDKCPFRRELQLLLEGVLRTLSAKDAKSLAVKAPSRYASQNTQMAPLIGLARTRDVLSSLLNSRDKLMAAGVKSLGFFGSSARGEAGPDSDVDLCYELSVRPNLANIAKVEDLLSKLLLYRLDLVLKDSLRPEILASAEKEMIRVI